MTNFSETTEDTDGDSLFDLLHINGELAVQVADEFEIAGSLRNGSGTEVGKATAYVDAAGGTGVYSFQLSWTNREFLATGEDGPWYLEDLIVRDATTDLSLEHEATLAYGPSTISFLSQFDPFPPPVPESVSPNFGHWNGGMSVIITGEAVGLDPNVTVLFGNVPCSTVHIISENMIAVDVPPNKQSGKSVSKGGKQKPAPPASVHGVITKKTVNITISNAYGSGVLTDGWTYYL